MADNEAWRDQLVQLNERARAYTAQQWQVPLAYVAIIGVTVGNLVKEGNDLPGIVGLLILGIVGGLVRWHMLHNRKGAANAVCWIQKAEEVLSLWGEDQKGHAYSANYREWAHVPLEWIVSLVALASGLGSLIRLWVLLGYPACWYVVAGGVVAAIGVVVIVICEGKAPKKARAKWEEECKSIVVGEQRGERETNERRQVAS